MNHTGVLTMLCSALKSRAEAWRYQDHTHALRRAERQLTDAARLCAPTVVESVKQVLRTLLRRQQIGGAAKKGPACKARSPVPSAKARRPFPTVQTVQTTPLPPPKAPPLQRFPGSAILPSCNSSPFSSVAKTLVAYFSARSFLFFCALVLWVFV